MTSHFSHLYWHTNITNCFVCPNEKLIHFISPKLNRLIRTPVNIIRTTDTFLYLESQNSHISNPALGTLGICRVHCIFSLCAYCKQSDLFDFDHSVFRLVFDPYQILEFWPLIKQFSLPWLFASATAPLYLCINKECVRGIFFWQPALYGHLDNWIIQTVYQVPMSVLTTLVIAEALLGGGGGVGRKVHTCMFLVWISNRVVARLRSRPCPCWYLTHLKIICRLLPFHLSYALF